MTFISGTYFKQQCKWRFTDYTDERNCVFSLCLDESADNNYVFCKTEYLRQLAEYSQRPGSGLPSRFQLFTHNSDLNITSSIIETVLPWFPQLKHWYTQNLIDKHPKVSAIPIGLANPKWAHGNLERFQKISRLSLKKNNLTYVNFNVATNPVERSHCLNNVSSVTKTQYPNWTKLEDHNKFVHETQEKYLQQIKRSYFTVSPDGNGKDCHKTWEALYMQSIPIVTKSFFAEQFKKLGIPLIILSDWSEFKSLKLCPNLYHTLWGDFDPFKINLKTFLHG